MPRKKRKLTPAQRRARRERKKKYQTIFVHGKQKRVPREPTIDGLAIDEFIARNADPIWLVQNELWEYLPVEPEYAGQYQITPEQNLPDQKPGAQNSPDGTTEISF